MRPTGGRDSTVGIATCYVLDGIVWHAATIPNRYSEINVTFYSVTLARTIRLPVDGPRAETCRSVFNV